MIDIAPHFGKSVLEQQRIRQRDERPRIPWDSHPGWTEHAMRQKVLQNVASLITDFSSNVDKPYPHGYEDMDPRSVGDECDSCRKVGGLLA